MKLLLLFVFYLSSVVLPSDLVLAGVLECTENEDCIASDATCIEELCVCPHGKTFSSDGSRCLELVVGYESACEDDTQCAWLLGKYVCNSESQCVCAEGWRYHNGRCIAAKGLGESCALDEDCFVSNDIYSMVCSEEGYCACNKGYYERGGYDCRPIGTKPGDFCALDMDCQFEDAFCDRSWCEYNTRRYNTSSERKSEIQISSPPKEPYEFGGSCSTSEDCSGANSFCSPLTKTCTCARGYFLHASGECTAELGADIGCTVDSNCTVTPRRCVNGACACPLTHYFGRGRNKCVKVSFSPDFACVNDEWCGIFGPGATCVGTDETYCRCPSGMQLDASFVCRRVTGGGGCVVNNDCYALQNSICQDGQCICPPNHRVEENACLPNIGGQCSPNSRCLIEHTECREGVCTCEDNYIPHGELECIEATGGLESPCNSDLQCSLVVENSACINEICNCNDGYQVSENDECLEVKLMGSYCVLPIQCHVLLGNNVQCRNSMCQCSADMEVTPDGLDCRYPNAAPSGRHASSSFLITLVLVCIAGY